MTLTQHDVMILVAGAAVEYFVGVFSRLLAKKSDPANLSKVVKVQP